MAVKGLSGKASSRELTESDSDSEGLIRDLKKKGIKILINIAEKSSFKSGINY